MSKQQKYSLDQLLKPCDKLGPVIADPIPDILDSEWPPYEDITKPFAYRILDWRGHHVAIVKSRQRAHDLRSQTDFDPRLNCIYAVYPDESEKLIQGGLSLFDDLTRDDFEEHWREVMQSMNIDDDNIETTLAYYREHPPE